MNILTKRLGGCVLVIKHGLAMGALLAFISLCAPLNSEARVRVTTDLKSCASMGMVSDGGTGCVTYEVLGGGGGGSNNSGVPDGGGSGGGGERQPTPSVLIQSKDAGKAECVAGNPIVLSTGNKIEPVVDFISKGEAALGLSRTYNHYWTGAGLFGKHWVSNFDYKLTFGSTDLNACYPRPGGGTCGLGGHTVIYAWRPDGRTIKYLKAEDGVFYEDKPDAIARIVNNGGSLTLYSEDNDIEVYSSAGYIQNVRNEYDVGWAYSYNGTYPSRVTHTSGRYVEFTWSSGQLTAVRDTAGNYYGYAYHANQFGSGLHRLAASTKPGEPATATAYHYELDSRPGALTGKSINGARYSTFTYDGSGYATSTEHNGVNKHTFGYTPGSNGLLTVVETNPLGKRTTYTFENGKARTVVGHPSTYCPNAMYAETTYDSNGYPLLRSDFNGVDTAYTYSAKGQLLQMIEAYGTPLARTTQYVWDTVRNRILSVTLVGVSRTTLDYDAVNRVSRVTITNLSSIGIVNQSRSTWYSYGYHAPVNGNMFAVGMLAYMMVQDSIPGSNSKVIRYDTLGNLISADNGHGHAITYSNHNGLGQPGRATNANGGITDNTFDARGRLISVRTYRNGGVQDAVYAYDGDDRLAKVTAADGVAQDYSYLTSDRDLVASVSIDSSGVLSGGGTQEKRSYSYTLMGDPSTVSDTVMDVLKRSDTTLYDELGRARARTGNNGQNVRYAYAPNGNIETVTDSLDRVTAFTYDKLDRLIRSVDPLLGATEFQYDLGDRLIWVKDPRGLITSYQYDGFGQLWAQYSPDTGTTSYQYDAAGQRTRMTRNDGSQLIYQYDGLGRLTYSGTPEWARSYSYDWCNSGKGKLCGIQVNDVQSVHSWTHFGYYPEGQLYVRRDSVYGADDWTGYSYDGVGRLAGMSYPSGVSVGYGYSYGKLTVVQATINGTTRNVVNNIKYQPFGPPAEWTYGNGLHRLMNRDLDGRLTAIHTHNYQGLYYGHNTNDEIVDIINGRDRNYDQSFRYDALSRLVGMASPSGNQSLEYDKNGNRTRHLWAVDMYYNNDPTSNRFANEHIAYTYDGRGNRQTQSWGGSTATYSYDAYNRMIGVNRDVASTYKSPGNWLINTYPAGTTNYRVNALDQRVGKSGALGTSRFIYGGQSQMLAEQTSGTWSSYIWIGSTPVGLVRNNQLYYVHADHVDRPDIVTDDSLNPVWYAANNAFDRVVLHDQIGGLNLGFPGQYYDRETGFWQNGFRDYDSRTGRYLQSDPIGLSGGLNTYAYVGGNPISFIDPEGLQAYTPGLTPPSIIPGGPWTPAPGQAPGTFYGPPNGSNRAVCRYVPDAKNGGPKTATKGAYWKTKTPSTSWQRYSLRGSPVTPQQAHPGTRNTISPWSRATWFTFLMTHSPGLNESEDQELEIRREEGE